MPSESGQPQAHLYFRRQVRERLHEIKSYIDQQRGDDPNDETGGKVLQRIFHDLFFIRHWPYAGQQVQGLSYPYRKRRIGGRYVLYYYVDDTENAVYLIDLRHSSQKPLKPATIRAYKAEIDPDAQP